MLLILIDVGFFTKLPTQRCCGVLTREIENFTLGDKVDLRNVQILILYESYDAALCADPCPETSYE